MEALRSAQQSPPWSITLIKYRHVLCLFALVLIVAAIIASYFSQYALDDSFIGYVNAVHLAEGKGFSFNPPDRLLTTSAPLMVLIYAAFLRYAHIDVVLQGQIWSAVALLLIAIFAYLNSLCYAKAFGAFAAAFVLVTSPNIIALWSHETIIATAFALIGIYLHQRHKNVFASFVLGIGALVRPEVLFCVAFLSLFLFVDGRRKQAMWFALIGCIPYILWAIPALMYFGSITSSSIAAKHAQSLYVGVGYIGGLVLATRLYYGDLSGWPALGFLMMTVAFPMGMGMLCMRNMLQLSGRMMLWCAFLTIFYIVMQVYYFAWFAMQVPILASMIAVAPWIKNWTLDRFELISMKSLSIVVLGVHAILFIRLAAVPSQKFQIQTYQGIVEPKLYDNNYYRLALYLRDHTSPHDSIAYSEIGILRYFSERTIIDNMGLATPGVATHLLAQDGVWYMKAYHPSVYVDLVDDLFIGGVASPLEYDWFARAYVLDDKIHFANQSGSLRNNFRLFRLRRPSEMPPLETRVSHLDVAVNNDERILAFTAPAMLTAVDVRLDTKRCSNGSLELISGANAVGSRRIFPSPYSEVERVRLEVPPTTLPGSALAVRIHGCSNALAPPIQPHGFNVLMNSSPLGSPANALTAYTSSPK